MQKQNKRTQKWIFSFEALLLSALLFPFTSHAAILAVVAPTSSTEINQLIRIDVALDTQGDDINAIQGIIMFPSHKFILERIDDGDSFVSFWISPPTETTSGTVSFAGIVPDGFQGAASSVVSLWLLPTASGSATVSLSGVSLLRNDGHASSVSTTLESAAIAIASTVMPGTASNPISVISPQPFTPAINQDPNIYHGHYFLAFSTTDKGSGIDHYEVMEIGTGEGKRSSGWHIATSPYLLEDQSLSSDVYVRAVDHAGNFIVVEIPAKYPQREGTVFLDIICILLLVILGLVLFGWIFRRLRKK